MAFATVEKCMICAEKSFSNYRTESAVKFYLYRYFAPLGVSEDVYLSGRYIEMCMNTDVLSGTRRAYKAMEGHDRFADSEENSHAISKDVRFVIKTLDRMSRSVPQELSMGMLLAHLEIIEGLSV